MRTPCIEDMGTLDRCLYPFVHVIPVIPIVTPTLLIP
jgi:hypothetical protein